MEAHMKAETFSRLLEQLVEEAWERRINEPHSKLSTSIAAAMVEVFAQKAPCPDRKPQPYGEMLEEPQIVAEHSLSELKAQISKAASAEDLRRLRREFAKHLHPDHCAGPSHDAATSDMAAVNRLIDEAMAAIRRNRRATL
jgi:hypothetical protein